MPASGPEVFKTSIIYGADAVYIGGEAFGLRSGARNFTHSEMASAINYAHERDVKVYVTCNIFAHNYDLAPASEYFQKLAEIKPDALIISDPGMFSLARRNCPDIDIHISTQANNTNYETYRFWYDLGVRRVVSARELSLDELSQIRRNIPPDMEIETFVHGAMCISYSGRCLLSNYFTGRDANQGSCTHPCRWKYHITEDTRPDDVMPVEEDERGTYIFNSKDLCMIEHIPGLIEAGIDSFKVEGRMKTALYAATIARAYRNAIDDYFISRERYESNLPRYSKEVRKCTHRRYHTGFFFGKPSEQGQIYDESTYINEYIYLGTVESIVPAEDGTSSRAKLTQKNKFCVGDTLEIMKSDGTDIEATVLEIRDNEGTLMDSCPHASMTIYVAFDKMPEENDVLRMRKQS